MTDALATPRITQFLLVALGNGATEGERINAIGQLQRELKKADCDAHDLVKRLALTEQQAQQILDAGIAKGRAEEAENARRNAVTTVAAPFVAGDVGRGVGSYTWLEIARHCACNTHRLNDWERRFAASVVRQLRYKPPSPDQAAKLHQIFYERFGERI